KVNTPFFFLPKAANQFKFISPSYNQMFECDVLYIGSQHPVINKICSIVNNLQIKIFGDPIGNEYYCGYISEKLIGDAFKTAKIVVHLHETECSQQLFDALYCGASV